MDKLLVNKEGGRLITTLEMGRDEFITKQKSTRITVIKYKVSHLLGQLPHLQWMTTLDWRLKTLSLEHEKN